MISSDAKLFHPETPQFIAIAPVSPMESSPQFVIEQYYKTLTSSPESLQNFFSKTARICISKEKDAQEPVVAPSRIQNAHGSGVSQVFISSLDIHCFENTFCHVVGQFVYSDGVNQRFVEFLVLDKENTIICSNVRLLDEEIVYEKYENYIGRQVKDFKKAFYLKNAANATIAQVIQAFRCFGKIANFERKQDGSAYIEMESTEACDAIRKNPHGIVLKGFQIDVDRRLPY